MKRLLLTLMVLCLLTPAMARAQTEMESRLHQLQNAPPGVTVGTFGEKEQFVEIEPSATCKEYHFQLGGKAVIEKDGRVHLHIQRAVKTSIQFDMITLDVGGEKLRPIRAIADGRDVTRKLAAADNDSIAFQQLDITFPAPKDPKALEGCSITLVAAAAPQQAVALPTSNAAAEIVQTSKYYDYEIGSRKGALVIDGRLTPEEQLGKPSFKEKVKDAGGGEERSIHVWAMDDGAFLYVALDVMADTTINSEDRSILYVRGVGPLGSFPVGVNEETYGKIGTAPADKDNPEHRVYEFKVPFGKLPRAEDGKLGLAFMITM